MTPVRMVHEKHGATHAYDHAELERLKGYGWKPEDEGVVHQQQEAPKRGRPRKP